MRRNLLHYLLCELRLAHGRRACGWAATFDDPVFFTRPWSITRSFTRFDDSKDRILPYTCTENNLDLDNLRPNQPNLDYKYQPESR